MRDTNTISSLYFYILLSLHFLISFSKFSIARDTITSIQSLQDGETIVSSGESFVLGFFSPGNSKNRYLGIWYKKVPIQTFVWVANRNKPITDFSGVVKIGEQSNLIVLNRDATTLVWSSSNQSKSQNPVIAQLLDSGNLVIREEHDNDPENYLWQSFDYPTDTLLPGMKLGWNLKTGIDRYLTSWNNSDDPSEGAYSFKIDLHGFPQAFITNRLNRHYRSGPWNGFQFSGVPEMKPNEIFDFNFTSNEQEVYYTFILRNESFVSRLVMTQLGKIRRFTWHLDNTSSEWNVYWEAPKDQCDDYMECGNYGICDTNDSPVCKCVRGYEPRYQQNWYYLRDGSGGCIQKTKFECHKDDGFLKMMNMKVPDGSSGSFYDMNMSLSDCEAKCRKNCSCIAYANSNIVNGGSGCYIWVNDLIDLRHYAEGGQDVYVRVAASLLGDSGITGTTSLPDSDKSKRVTFIVIVTVIPAFLLLVLCCCCCSIWMKKKKKNNNNNKSKERDHKDKSQDLPPFDVVIPVTRDHSDENNDDLELPLFDLGTLVTATFNFSDTNKLGQGGFGTVYKGILSDGKEIAVKRLSKDSGQGIDEFKNEVMLIARLQHRNLVRLLGCCIEGEEKMLIYEYMKNRSLDCHLFEKTKGLLLDWKNRFNIIGGIARGLLYLHQDSRFRIIHRDLKASNVLLDGDMNPKISDFGMARIFGGDQTEANTKRVVGTYGYMSPEYAMDGLFSIKSDVFSFGVLVLEIISGKKNRGFHYSNQQHNLLGHAWRLWREGKSLELMDETMGDSCPTYEVLRCMQVGLICVQERAEDRPTMSTVVLMLSSESTAVLPQPKQPGFSLLVNSETESSSTKQESCTVNQVTVTMLEAR